MVSVGLHLTLFGGLSVQRGNQPVIALNSQKARALLCYLALTDQPQSRPVLAGLLWGAMSESNSRMNLRKALKQLRQQVSPHLLISRGNVAFNRNAPHSIDVVTLQEVLNQTKGRSEIPPGLLTQMERAVALYQGDFLEGFYVRNALEFERWVLGRRAYFRELALQLMQAVASEHARQGRYQPAIEFTRLLLEVEPWREGAHRNLMRWLAYDGQRGAALAHYKICRNMLQEEFGVEPAEETQSLFRSIQWDALKPPAQIINR